MVGILLKFRAPSPPPLPKPQNWSNQELADLYRVAQVLTEAGLRVDTDSGLTDEGDPWFVFFRPETEEVIVHFARLNGVFLACSANGATFTGPDFRTTINKALQDQPLLMPAQPSGGNLYFHPTTLLAAFVAAAWMFMEGVSGSRAEAHTLEPNGEPAAAQPEGALATAQTLPSGLPAILMTRTGGEIKVYDLSAGLSHAQAAAVASILTSAAYLLTTSSVAATETAEQDPLALLPSNGEPVRVAEIHVEGPLLVVHTDPSAGHGTVLGVLRLSADAVENEAGAATLLQWMPASPADGAFPTNPAVNPAVNPVVVPPVWEAVKPLSAAAPVEAVKFDPNNLAINQELMQVLTPASASVEAAVTAAAKAGAASAAAPPSHSPPPAEAPQEHAGAAPAVRQTTLPAPEPIVIRYDQLSSDVIRVFSDGSDPMEIQEAGQKQGPGYVSVTNGGKQGTQSAGSDSHAAPDDGGGADGGATHHVGQGTETASPPTQAVPPPGGVIDTIIWYAKNTTDHVGVRDQSLSQLKAHVDALEFTYGTIKRLLIFDSHEVQGDLFFFGPDVMMVDYDLFGGASAVVGAPAHPLTLTLPRGGDVTLIGVVDTADLFRH